MGIVPEKGVCSDVSTAQISLALWDNGEVLKILEGSGMQRMYQSRAKGRVTQGENQSGFMTLTKAWLTSLGRNPMLQTQFTFLCDLAENQKLGLGRSLFKNPLRAVRR